MAFRAIPNGVRVVHLGRMNGVNIVNTIGGENDSDSMKAIADRHGAAWRAHIVPSLAQAYVHEATLCYDLENEFGSVGQATLTGSASSGHAGAPAAMQCALVVTARTAERGRTRTGRLFLPAQLDSGLASNRREWTAAHVATFQAKVDAYKAAVDPTLSNQGGRMAVLSKGRLNKATGEYVTPAAVTPVTSLLVRTYLGTQRRRLR